MAAGLQVGVDELLRFDVPLHRHGTGILYLQLRAAFVLLAHHHQDPLQHVDGFETADDDGRGVLFRQRRVDLRPRDDADVRRPDERVDLRPAVAHDRVDRRRHEDMVDVEIEIFDLLRQRRLDERRRHRRRRLETDGKEDDLLPRIFLRDFKRVHRRVERPHVIPCGPLFRQAALRSRHADHVAERHEDGILHPCKRNGVVDPLFGHDADRAARAVDKVDVLRQQLRQPVLHNGMRMAAADFHDAQRCVKPFRLFADLRGQQADRSRVPETIVKVFELQLAHGALPCSQLSPSITVRRRSSSSIFSRISL